MRARRARFSLFAGGLAGLCLLASGCGGSPGSHVAQLATGSGTSTPRGSSPSDPALAFARCMQTHGVPLWPDPTSRATSDGSPLTLRELGVTSSQLAAAEQSCRSLLPPTPSASAPSSHTVARALIFSRCMRVHGATNFPDPESNGAIAIPHSMESSPAYLAALHFCLHAYGAPPPPTPAHKS